MSGHVPDSDWVFRHVALLLERHPDGITLDAIGEAVGAQRVSVTDIEALFDELERRGVAVEDGLSAELPILLERVLGAARALRARGEALSPAAVARECGAGEREVRVALLFARVLER